MPFQPGERVDWLPIHPENPDACVFVLEGRSPLSLANGGLVLRRKGALHPVFVAPREPGKYAYRWLVDGAELESAGGHVRVEARKRRPTSGTRLAAATTAPTLGPGSRRGAH